MKALTTCLAVLILTGAIAGSAKANPPPCDSSGPIGAYNMNVIGSAISLYYSHHVALPESLTQLIKEGWVPPNLVNLYTGETITGDCTGLGGYSIIHSFPPGVVLTSYTDGNSMAEVYTDASFKDNTLGSPEDVLRAHSWMNWAREAAHAYHAWKGKWPESIADLSDARLWPFEGLKNPYTGQPMKFDSDTVGDMKWQFGPGFYSVEFRHPDGPKGERVYSAAG